MKNLLTLVFTFLSLALFAQFEPCHLVGPGSADGGTDPVVCGTTANYSFQNINDGSVCQPDLQGGAWSWCIDNLGSPGFLNLNANSNYPVNFTMDNGVIGSVVGASQTSVTIKWDCADCTDCTVSHINLMYGCAEEIYQSSIFVECPGCGGGGGTGPTPCSVDQLDCILTDCKCVQVCINGVIIEVINDSDEDVIFCFEGDDVIDGTAPCGVNLPCKEDDPDTGKGDGKGRRSGDGPTLIEIPASNVRTIQNNTGSVNIELQLPESDRNYELVVFDSAGRTIQSNTVYDSNAVIGLNNLMPGIYMVTITDGSTVITHKIFVK